MNNRMKKSDIRHVFLGVYLTFQSGHIKDKEDFYDQVKDFTSSLNLNMESLEKIRHLAVDQVVDRYLNKPTPDI